MAVESWDDDADFQGDFQSFAATSTGTVKTSLSSRLSVHSESLAGDEDWNVVLPSDDQKSTVQAIQSAKEAGIPLPDNVPSSALLGGAIRRLGRKKSRQKLNEDWDNDLVMADGPLQLKNRTVDTSHLSTGAELDDFDDLEGSLGIRFAGTRRSQRARSSSTSMMSPSLGSATADSDVDELGGLELPPNPIDFEAILLLKKRRAADADLAEFMRGSPTPDQPPTKNVHKKSRLFADDDNDDFMNDFDFGGAEAIDVRKRTTNKNVQVKSSKAPTATSRPATTLNFHDKPTDKPIYVRSGIPRPVSGSKQTSRLEPVMENGAHATVVRERRQPTTTSAQLLRSKRSAPALRNQHSAGSLVHKSSAPFLQSSPGTSQRPMPFHLRNHSGNARNGAQSPPPVRPHSRLSQQLPPETPSRASKHRPDHAPPSLAREASSKRVVTRPTRSRDFGTGFELEAFDDLPTSSTKESRFVKAPSSRGMPRQGLRQTQSRGDMRDTSRKPWYVPDRMMTPAPPRTPASPTKGFHEVQAATPSYLRDTAASRIARESRLGHNARPRSEGPLQPLSTNWKAQVAARSPHTSPSAQRPKGRGPGLIAGIGATVARSEKGMYYNPQTLRWEGNENTLNQFDNFLGGPLETPTPSSHNPQTDYMDGGRGNASRARPLNGGAGSPSRPALITQIPTGNTPNIQVQNGMVFDPMQMKWLKVKGGRDVSGQFSPSVTDADEEEDAFAGIEDLKDDVTPAVGAGGAASGMISPVSNAPQGASDLLEEFDMGPKWITWWREEEVSWFKRCDPWFEGGVARPDDGAWRWSIRNLASEQPGLL